MHDQRFDRLATRMAGMTSRRRFLGAGLVAPLGARGQATPAATTEERSVVLYEQLADLADNHHGTCAQLTEKVRAFATAHQVEIAAAIVAQRAWNASQKRTHVATYGERRRAATRMIEAAAFKCHFSAHPQPFPGLAGGTSPATPAASPEARAMAVQPLVAAMPAPGPFDCPNTQLECTITNGVNSAYSVGTQIGRITVGMCRGNPFTTDCSPCDQGHDNYAGTCANDYGPCSYRLGNNLTLTCEGLTPSSQSCDCTLVCSQVTVTQCLSYALGTLTGSGCSSCWTSMCTSQGMCELDCTQNECCATACS